MTQQGWARTAPVVAVGPPLASIFGSGFLILAYVISVSLYLHILASFVLGGFNADTELNENIITTAVIGVIVFIGITKGLAPLEFLETWALFSPLPSSRSCSWASPISTGTPGNRRPVFRCPSRSNTHLGRC